MPVPSQTAHKILDTCKANRERGVAPGERRRSGRALAAVVGLLALVALVSAITVVLRAPDQRPISAVASEDESQLSPSRIGARPTPATSREADRPRGASETIAEYSDPSASANPTPTATGAGPDALDPSEQAGSAQRHTNQEADSADWDSLEGRQDPADGFAARSPSRQERALSQLAGSRGGNPTLGAAAQDGGSTGTADDGSQPQPERTQPPHVLTPSERAERANRLHEMRIEALKISGYLPEDS